MSYTSFEPDIYTCPVRAAWHCDKTHSQRRLIMKASNILISTAAAISMAGVLGLAYAQSTYSDTQTGTSGTTMNQDSTGATSQESRGTTAQESRGTMNQESADTTGTTRSDSMYTARVARADRN
jgi:hypothetical protein